VVFPDDDPPATPSTNGRRQPSGEMPPSLVAVLFDPSAVEVAAFIERRAYAAGGGATPLTDAVWQDGSVALSEREMAVLDFERTWWTQDGVKATLIRERFACSEDEYYTTLNALLDRPEALDHDPLMVRRLLRFRDRRRRNRLDDAANGAFTGEGGLHA
jgi:hypothetical protein